MSVCPHTGVTRPECSCFRCLAEQIRQFQPALLEADPTGVMRGPGTGAGESAAGRRAAA